LSEAVIAAGPRYTHELNIETPLWTWFSTFEAGTAWREQFESLLKKCSHTTKNLRRHLETTAAGSMSPPWPAEALQLGKKAANQLDALLTKGQTLLKSPDGKDFAEFSALLETAQTTLEKLETPLVADLEAKHGEGSADSQPFRHHMAEYQCCFPAANLDAAREATKEVRAFADWLSSPAGFLAFKKTFVLTGAGGSGKTHGICDMALKRLETGAYTCVVFGHQFSGQPNVWTRMIESLGLPPTLSKNGLLDTLNTAAEASDRVLIFCIDAINETRPRRDYWLQHFLPIAQEFEKRPRLKLCVSCRTSFRPVCLPKDFPHPVVEHMGFSGIERQACNAFFRHYELDPPLVPVLQPELSNPLYLKLVCQTLKLKGLRQLPAGWNGMAPVIRAFLSEKENQFAAEHGISAGAAIVSGSLLAIASAIAESGESSVPWSQAQEAIIAKRPQAASFQVIDWLVRQDLLIEDGPDVVDTLVGENVLRPAFERFGDFLIAVEMLNQIAPLDFEREFSKGGKLAHLFETTGAAYANAGVLLALSVLIPETRGGTELPDFVAGFEARDTLLEFATQALPWRTPETFSTATRRLVSEALAGKQSWDAMDSLLSIATQVSELDAYWVASLLGKLPLAKRDAFWCSYLHDSFDKEGIVKRLIDASKDIALEQLKVSTAERWALILVWFTAAADRRVKDYATRSAIALLRAQPTIIAPLIEHFISIDDDELRERILLCAYGALLVSPEKDILRATAEGLLTKYQKEPADFQNALIRDHIRCIAELAQHLEILNSRFKPLLPSAKNKSEWPLATPSEEQIKEWRENNRGLGHLARSCLDDDFNHYSINCLRPWYHTMDKTAIGGWILKHIVEVFGYKGSGCEKYDEHITYKSGGGRSKPTSAERIGKKYQWIALYQLASRMHDNVEPEKNSHEPEPLLSPLILQDERKLDPTLSQTPSPEDYASECWWIQKRMNLAATKNLDYAAWVKAQDDLPKLEDLLKPIDRGGQRWLVLTTYPNWNDREKDADFNAPYRSTWFHLRSYLVPKAVFAEACAALEGRNFFGEWMPDGAKWLHGFAGEYPWATSFNTEPDWWLGWRDSVRGTPKGSPLRFLHTSNEVVVEWEYDASLPNNFYLRVPAKELFGTEKLWWNGTDGFQTPEGKTVFRDPHLLESGPQSLIADVEDLVRRIDKLGYRLLWTFLGEKMVVKDSKTNIPTIIYSQIAYLNEDGSIGVGKRVFFDDWNKNQGLGKAKP
jgi:hypothetical protein